MAPVETPEQILQTMDVQVAQVGKVFHATFYLPLLVDGHIREIVVTGVDHEMRVSAIDLPKS